MTKSGSIDPSEYKMMERAGNYCQPPCLIRECANEAALVSFVFLETLLSSLPALEF